MFFLWIATSLAMAAPSGGKLTCSSKELQRRDCRLTSGSYNLRLLDQTVAWNDGTWHTVDPMPLSGEGIAWEKVRFEFMAGHPIVQMWLWDKPVGEAQVQSLHWYVADAEKRKFTVLAEGIVRKRHLKEPLMAPEEAAASEKKATAKPKYLYDAWEPHGLRALKDGRLEWSLRGNKKIIEKVKHGI